MIYALLSQNILVAIYAILIWKVDTTNFCTFKGHLNINLKLIENSNLTFADKPAYKDFISLYHK